jgi:S1-C subfamily serine protease
VALVFGAAIVNKTPPASHRLDVAEGSFFCQIVVGVFPSRVDMNIRIFFISVNLLPLFLLLMAGEQAVTAADGPRRTLVVKAVEKALPSVVNIRTETVVEVRDPFAEVFRDFWNPYYRQPRQDVRRSLGSGVIIHADGYVLTNDHVVRRATKIRVKFADGREFEAERVAYDQRSDLALLRILKPKEARTKFIPAPFARDDDLLLGETVVALGNPFGLGGSVSQGILSSKDRQEPREGEMLDMVNWLQTDAAVNPGNSGGPLINLDGELIGINVAIHRQGQGIGFAIPIARVNETLGRFFTPEQLRGLWLGARAQLDGDRLRLAEVEANSPAAKAGLRAGDTILEVNNHPVDNFVDWAKEVAGRGLEKVKFKIFRGGRALPVTVTLQAEDKVFNSELLNKRLGLSIRTLTERLSKQLGMSFYGGFLITNIEEDGPGAKAGLERSAVIQRVDDQQPESLVAFARNINNRDAGSTVKLNVVWEVRRGAFLQRRSGIANVKIR